MPKVSVIIPVYNVEKYLEECLDSVINQTLKDIEIICVNDGSTDGSIDILKQYSEKDERITVVSQENAGAGAARNNGLKRAKGKYLSFLDSDDFFDSCMLEKAFALAESDKADFVVYKSDQYYTEENQFKFQNWVVREKEIPPYHPFNYRQVTTNIFKVFVGWAWDKLYLKEFVDRHNLTFQEQRTTNDMLFVFSALFLAKRISVLPEILAHQRRDSADSISKTREKSWQCFYNALSALKQRIKDEGLYAELEKDFVNYALHASLWNYNSLAEPTKNMLYEKLKKEWFIELGIADRPEEYFYIKDEYEQYKTIIGN